MKKEGTPPRSQAPGPRPRCCQREPQDSASPGGFLVRPGWASLPLPFVPFCWRLAPAC